MILTLYPQGFEWSDIDLENPTEQQELYQLLNENYVEDDDNMFRLVPIYGPLEPAVEELLRSK